MKICWDNLEKIRYNKKTGKSADMDNCITLCVKCHKETHRLPGCGYYELRCN
jgi:hypothetical protein